MHVAISPYHLTTREAAAMASLLLAERAVTMLPRPGGGNGAANGSRSRFVDAASEVPRYLEVMEHWQWSMPLFREGVVQAFWEGEDAAEDVRRVCGRIESDESLRDLRPLMKVDLFEDERAYLDAIARDLLKGGPDPALTVPVAAGMDRFATRHELVVARSAATSVAQKAEARMGTRLFAVAVPVLVQASADRLLEARELLLDPLEQLRMSLADVFDQARLGEPFDASFVRSAAAEYEAAFEVERDVLLEPEEDEFEPRVLSGMVSITGMTMPVDAVLRSSLEAVRVMRGEPGVRGAVAAGGPGEVCTSIVVKVLGR